MHPSLPIRTARPSDAPRLAALATQVWLHTYATEGITEDMAAYVLSEFSVARFSASLGQAGLSVLLAEQGAGLVGFAALRWETPCPAPAATATSTVELQTLYVQEHFIGHGVGHALLDAAQSEAHTRAASPLWLKVNARNARAIAFYARQGYTQVGRTDFVLGQGHHENHVLLGPTDGRRGAGSPLAAR